MDIVINIALVSLYVLALIFSRNKPLFPIFGLMAIIAMNSLSGYMQSEYHNLVDTYGFDGYAYRWESGMAFITFLWFCSIQKTERLIILIPVATLLGLDIMSMMLSTVNTSPIDPYLAIMNVFCHLTYIWGCVSGATSINTLDNSIHKGDAKGMRGYKK